MFRERRFSGSGIYAIVNTVNGKRYIGSSVDMEARIRYHRRALTQGDHTNKKLQNAFDKYLGNFVFVALERVNNKESLVETEQRWIDKYDCVRLGYNICPVASSTLGIKIKRRTKILWSIHRRGAGNGMYGRTHTREVKKRLSDLHIGMRMPVGFRKKMSSITSGKGNGMYGRSHRPESITKMKEKASERDYRGTNNPNYGNRWSEDKKEKASIRIINSSMFSGDRNPNCKIKSTEYKRILNLYYRHRKTIKYISSLYCVSHPTISKIIKGDSRWAEK